MDVYVVLHFKGAGATVLGAGANLADAKKIADRHRVYGMQARWQRQEEPGLWFRESLVRGEDQTITCVPLAGYQEMAFTLGPDTSALLERDRARQAAADRYNGLMLSASPMAQAMSEWRDRIESGLIEQVERQPPTWTEMMALVERMKVIDIPAAEKIRCGNGEAWDWLRSGLEQVATYPSDSTLPDSQPARILGIDVVLDPNIPPNVIRFGDKVFMLKGDTVIEVDLSRFRAYTEAINPITIPLD